MAAQLLLLLMPQLGGHLGQTARTDNSDGCGSLVLLSTAAAAAAAAPPSLAPRPSIRPRALAPRPLEHLLLASRTRCCNMSDSSCSSWNMMGEDGRMWPVAVTQGKICSIMYICTYIYMYRYAHASLFPYIQRCNDWQHVMYTCRQVRHTMVDAPVRDALVIASRSSELHYIQYIPNLSDPSRTNS